MQGFLNLDGGGVGQPPHLVGKTTRRRQASLSTSKLSLEEARFTPRVSSPQGHGDTHFEVTPQVSAGAEPLTTSRVDQPPRHTGTLQYSCVWRGLLSLH